MENLIEHYGTLCISVLTAVVLILVIFELIPDLTSISSYSIKGFMG